MNRLALLLSIILIVSAKVGQKCKFNNDCKPNSLLQETCSGLGLCTLGKKGDKCTRKADCHMGNFCINGSCNDPLKDGHKCTNKDHCGSHRCILGKCSGTNGVNGACESNFDCKDQLPKLKCDNKKCTKVPTKNFGEKCDNDLQCAFHCNEGTCYGGASSSGCKEDWECTGKGGRCCDGKCSSTNAC